MSTVTLPDAAEQTPGQLVAAARRSPRTRWPLYLLAGLLTFFLLFPIYLITIAALSPRAALFAFPKSLIPTELSTETLTYKDLSMDLATHRVKRMDKDVHLGPTEFRLLRFLMENQGRVFSREQLLDHVWGRDIYVEPRTVDVHIRRLRKAINIEGAADVIRTVRAAGYSLDVEG